jgi:hypothetical protein
MRSDKLYFYFCPQHNFFHTHTSFEREKCLNTFTGPLINIFWSANASAYDHKNVRVVPSVYLGYKISYEGVFSIHDHSFLIILLEPLSLVVLFSY